MALNNPDKIIFVGEALVGNEAVDQLTKFDRALRDFSASSGGAGKERGIDGMLVTKWDTVDDKVCVSLIFVVIFFPPCFFLRSVEPSKRFTEPEDTSFIMLLTRWRFAQT